MAALLHDHPRPLLATEPVTRFLGLHAVPAHAASTSADPTELGAGVRSTAGSTAAAIAGATAAAAAGSAALAAAPPLPEWAPAPRPALRVIPGGREAALRQRRAPAVYRRRRLVALLGLLVLAVGACLTFDLVRGPSAAPLVEPAPVLGATAGSPAPSAAAPAPSAAPAPRPAVGSAPAADAAPASYLVQPGDTLWSIAEELAPGTDVRPLVDALAERSGGGVLEAGARIDLGGLDGLGG